MLRIIFDIEGHFQPEELAKRLKKAGHHVSLSTVYRNLPLLIEAGVIREANVSGEEKGGTCYEHVWGHAHHDHLICSRCGKRVEFNYPAIDVLQEAVARDFGFELERHHLELIGVCEDCLPAGRTEGPSGRKEDSRTVK